MTPDEQALLLTWQRKPHADFKDKRLHVTVAAKLAKYQYVSPNLPDVLHSLLSDGEAFFNGQTFEQWCGDFGYDADSRKSETIYRQCDLIGRKLAGAVPRDILDKAREVLADY